MKAQFLFGALLAVAVAASAQSASELPFPRVSIEEARALGDTKPVSLHLRDVSLANALQVLTQQSGIALDWSEGVRQNTLEKTLSLDLETRSFSQAFRAIMQAAGVQATLRPFDARGLYQVGWGASEAREMPQSGEWPFLIQLKGVNANLSKTVELDADMNPTRAQKETLSVQLEPINNPNAKITGAPIILLMRATDENGAVLLDAKRDQLQFFGSYQRHSFPSGLQMPATGTQKLAKLDGTAIYVLPSKRSRWEIPDVSQPGAASEFASGGQTIRVEVVNAQIADEKVDVYLKVTVLATGDAKAETLNNPLFSADNLLSWMRLQDANGQSLRSSGYSSTGGAQVTVRTQFLLSRDNPGAIIEENATENVPKQALKAPLRLIFDGPTEWVQTEVPFSFENVPLP